MRAVIGALRVNLGMNSVAFERGLSEAQKKLNRFGRDMSKIGDHLTRVGQTLTVGVTLPIVALGTAMTKTAIDAAEMQSAFDVSFGSMAKSAKAWAEQTGDALGRSTTEMQESMLAMHGLFKAGGPATAQTRALAEQFAVLGQDLSSFHNVAGKDVMAALKSGLSGEAEPMRRFNVYLTEGAVKAQALKMGLVGLNGELTEQAKIQARAALIMAGTTEAQGDVLRTADGAANRIRAAQAAWQELSVTLGTKVIPLLTPIVEKIAEVLNGFGKLSPAMQNTILIGAGVAAAIGPVVTAIGALATGLSALAPVLAAAAGGLAAIGAPVLIPIAAAVAGVVGAFVLFRGQIIPVLKDFGKTAGEVLGPKIEPLLEAAADAFRLFAETVGPLFKPNGQFGQAMAVFLNLTTRTFNAIVQIVGVAMDLVTASLKIVTALLKGDWGAALKGALSLTTIFQAGVMKVFAALAPEVVGWVKKTYEGVKLWLLDKLGDVVRIVGEKVAEVSAFFKGMWDAVVGHSYVPDMVEGIAEWFAKLDAGMIVPAKKATDTVKEQFEQLRDDVAIIFDGVLTDSQRAQREAAKNAETMFKALEAGVISDAQFVEWRKGLNDKDYRDNFESTVVRNEDPGNITSGVPTPNLMTEEEQSQLQGQIYNAWRGALDALQHGGFKGLMEYAGNAFATTLMDRAAEALTDLAMQFTQMMAQTNGTNGGGGWGQVISGLISWFSGTPAFATGGSFKVGGNGGTDSSLVAFRATPGEMVDIRHGNDNAPGGALAVHVTPSPLFNVMVTRTSTAAAAASGQAAYSKATRDVPARMQDRNRMRLA